MTLDSCVLSFIEFMLIGMWGEFFIDDDNTAIHVMMTLLSFTASDELLNDLHTTPIDKQPLTPLREQPFFS